MAQSLLANKYLLLKRIASGGMAEIFLAKQIGIDGFEKLVVVKRILPQFANAPDYVRMFLDEAKTAADLRHPNIVTTFEIAQDNGIYFMVMEYLHGLDLRYIFRRLSSHHLEISISIAAGLIMEACSGLLYAHKKMDLRGKLLGIVHRDISPQNLVVTFEGETKIVDFGIAQGTHLPDDAQSGILKGKFAYMSPEQATGQTLDHRSDQFSLGIMLYELTTMRRLFRRSKGEEALADIVKCEIEPPSSLISGYPSALEEIVMRTLQKDREHRFADCGELRTVLDGFLRVQGVPFSRDALSQFLGEHFPEHRDASIDVHAESEIHHATYLRPQTLSRSTDFEEVAAKSKFNWSFFILATIATMVISLCFGFAFYFVTEPVPTARQTNKNHGSHLAEVTSEEIISQSMHHDHQVENPIEESAAPKAKPKKGNGRLKVVVEPWGEVFVDGKHIGLTPLSAQKILEGTHTVRIVNSRLNKEKTLKVVIRANEDTLIQHQF